MTLEATSKRARASRSVPVRRVESATRETPTTDSGRRDGDDLDDG